MADQDKQTLENQNNPIIRLGEYGAEGGPGRPKGLKNRFTQIKQDMLEVWHEENGKERFRELFKGGQRSFIKALEKIVAILPKDSTLGLESTGETKIVIIRSAPEKEAK